MLIFIYFQVVFLISDWKRTGKVGKLMEYKISDICTNLGIGKSTIYDRIKVLKKEIPESDWKRNEYFYYTDNNKLFITAKGFDFIKNYNNKSFNSDSNFIPNVSTIYQNQIIKMYETRIEYLETENKRLLDIIAFKEQKELAKDVKTLEQNNIGQNNSFFSRFVDLFKHRQ